MLGITLLIVLGFAVHIFSLYLLSSDEIEYTKKYPLAYRIVGGILTGLSLFGMFSAIKKLMELV